MTNPKLACLVLVLGALVLAPCLAAQPARAIGTATETSQNLALHKRVTASSSLEQPGWNASLVVDGQRNEIAGARGWQSGGDVTKNHTEWLKIDLGAVTAVGKVDLYPRNDPARVGEGFPVDFAIGISVDGQTWTTTVRKANYPKPGDKVQSFSFNAVNGRYVRITGTNLRYLPAESSYFMQFAEVEVYAPAAAAGGSTGASSSKPALAGTTWQGQIQLNDGRTRTFTAAVDGNNKISGQITVTGGKASASFSLQGTYNPSTGAVSLTYGGSAAPGAEQGTLTATAASATDVSGQGTVTVSTLGQRRGVQATWSMGRR